MTRAQMKFWTQNRVNRVLATASLATVFGIVLSMFGPDADRGALQRGDFPAFYAAAVITASGQGERLYDPLLQARIENEHFPSLEGRYLAFVYPPYVARWLAPLSAHSAPRAKLLFTAGMVLAFLLAFRLFAFLVPAIRTHPWRSIGLAVLFAPLLTALLGGQNAALSLLCYALAVRAVPGATSDGEGAPGRGAAVWGGLGLGLWLMKPHFALIATVALAPLLPVHTLIVLLVCLIGSWGAGAVVMGPGWVSSWVTAVRNFSESDSIVNGHQMVSLVGATEAICRFFALDPSAPAAKGMIGAAYLISCAAIVYTCRSFLMLRSPGSTRKEAKATAERLRALLLAIGPLVVLASPHTLFYDLTLCMPAIAYRLVPRTELQISLTAGALAALFLCCLLRSTFPVQPLVLVAPYLFYSLLFRPQPAAKPHRVV